MDSNAEWYFVHFGAQYDTAKSIQKGTGKSLKVLRVSGKTTRFGYCRASQEQEDRDSSSSSLFYTPPPRVVVPYFTHAHFAYVICKNIACNPVHSVLFCQRNWIGAGSRD